MRQVTSAPVLSGPIPVLPTRESIRVSSAAVPGRASVRPPQRVAQREVVTRMAPPPPPPTFERKLEVIRESGGAPVRPDVSRRLSAEEPRGEKDVQQVRPAGRSEVLLAPRGEVKESRKPKPLPPTATRAPVTPDRPVLGRDETPPAREPRPRRILAPAVPPAPEPAPTREPQLKREAPKPPERRVEQPAPPPQPPATRPPAPAPRVEQKQPEARPDQAKPGKPEPKEENPKKVAPRPPKRGEKVPTPTPAPER